MELGIVLIAHSVVFLLIDLFVFAATFSNRKQSASQGAFFVFATLVSLSQAAAIVAIACEQYVFRFNSISLYLLYFLMMGLSVLVPYAVCNWLVRLFLPNNEKSFLWWRVIAYLPIFVFIAMSAVSFKTHWIYYIDENLLYQRGSMFFLQVVCPYLYLTGVAVIIFMQTFKKDKISKSKALKFMALLVLPPILGSIVQFFTGVRAAFPELGSSAGLILSYMEMYKLDVDKQNRLKEVAVFNEKLEAAYRQMKTILMRGELQAKTVADSIRGGFKICKNDKVFTFKYVSTQLAEMLGYTVEEFKQVSGGSMAGIVNLEDAAREIPHALKQIAAGDIYTMNYRMRCKDGSWKFVEDKGRLIKADGAEDEFWSFIVDKDEQVKMESALANVEKSRRELAEYNEIISNAGLGVWFIALKDGEHARMRINQKMREIMGVPDTIVAEEDIYDFWHDRVLESALQSVNDSVGEMLDGRFSENTYQWNHPTKGVVYVRCGGTADKMPDGGFVLSGYHSDVNDIVTKELEQQNKLKEALVLAEESNKAKTAFLNNMSHDIRTPMNAILGFATLMEKDLANPEKIKGYLMKLKNSGDFLLSLINNVLEMARIESGKVELNEQPSFLLDNTDPTMSIFEASLKERGLTISTCCEIQHEYVYVDLVRVREIIINLISNSIKYSKVGGHIRTSMKEIPCSREGYATYEFEVEDDGIGMSKDYLPRIFESFVREKNFTESKIAGTGLGLPIVKKLVDLMGGTISVQSELGKGTLFRYTLSHRICTPEDFEATRNGNSTVSDNVVVGKHILLAEDNDMNAEIADTLLTDIGFIVERAVDGLECVKMLERAGAGYFDVILMDIQMPNMDGYEATKAIRQMKDPSLKNIPIVAMTANAFAEDRKNALEAGMNAHLAKPINIDLLLKILSCVLSLKS